MTLFKAPVAILCIAALLAVSAPAYAQTPPDLRDLVGARAGQADLPETPPPQPRPESGNQELSFL